MFENRIGPEEEGPVYKAIVLYRSTQGDMGKAAHARGAARFKKIIEAILDFTANDPEDPPYVGAHAVLHAFHKVVTRDHIRIVLPVLSGYGDADDPQSEQYGISAYGELRARGRAIFSRMNDIFGPYGIMLRHADGSTFEAAIEGRSIWTVKAALRPASAHDALKAGEYLQQVLAETGMKPDAIERLLAGEEPDQGSGDQGSGEQGPA